MEQREFRIGDRQVNRGELFERGALAILSMCSFALPILDISTSGATDDVFLYDFQLIGGAAYLLSLAYAAGLFGMFAHAMRHHMRFIDLAGVVVTIVAISRAIYLIVQNAVPSDDQLSDATVAVTSIHLSYGSLPLLLLLAGGLWQLNKSWRH